MDQTQTDATPWDQSFEDAIQDRLAALDSGKYARDTENNLRDFAEEIATSNGTTRVEDIDVADCKHYAETLADRVDDPEKRLSTGASAQQKYAYVRAFLKWAVKMGIRETNPAKRNQATNHLPEATEKSERQFWTKRDRKAICATADSYVDRSLDNQSISQTLAYRDRAFVYVLAYSGCRGAELLDHPDDDARRGLRWSEADLDNKVLEVFGKSREWQPTPLLSPAVSPLKKWRRETPADGDDDPVFPRLDNAAKGKDHWPAMKVQSGRKALQRLCDWSDYEFDEYLKPHGARRGLGHELYEESAETAQEVLRHQDLETTHKSYRDQRTQELGERADSILSDE